MYPPGLLNTRGKKKNNAADDIPFVLNNHWRERERKQGLVTFSFAAIRHADHEAIGGGA